MKTAAHVRARRWPLPVLLLLVLGGLLGACDTEEGTNPPVSLTAEEFIAVVVELREAEAAVLDGDSAAEHFAERKAEILDRYGTTEDELRAFAEASARDVGRHAEIWSEISGRLRKPATADSLPAR